MKNYLVVLGPSTNCLHESEYIWNGFFIDKRILGPIQYTKFSCNTWTRVTAKPFNHENVLPAVSCTYMYTQCIELWSYKIIKPPI